MALKRQYPLHRIVNRLDILLPGNRPFIAPSNVIHAQQQSVSESVKRLRIHRPLLAKPDHSTTIGRAWPTPY
ncbi:hypothetical protein HH682_03665 [Rosenbergiella sp. S61]|uniref:Transposase n=1 Tax=Rosenbergiella gaditana TaxID=2726987 RepID=A0ABS5SWE9_9GAMM|nr:hypothetical protein [Rosenbergiella gaditana]